MSNGSMTAIDDGISRPDLSIVTTLYCSADYIAEFHRRASVAAAAASFSNVEFIFVNDGSPDDSLERALDIQLSDPRVKIIDFSRNFGHHFAIIAGLEHAAGDLVFLIDCDLEEDPECLGALLQALRGGSNDVAFGVQIKRKGGFVERWGGALTYRLIEMLAHDIRLPRDMLIARVMTRRYVDSMLRYGERAVVFSGLASLPGFRQIAVPMTKKAKGSTTYTLRRRLQMFVRTVTEFTDRPLHYIAYLGAAIFLTSLLYALYLLIVFLVCRTVPAGYTSLAASVWLLGGLIILSIGIVAIYLAVIFSEVKGRPRYIVRAVYDGVSRDDAPVSVGVKNRT